jgi:transposase
MEKRRKLSSEFKTKVVLESLKERLTLSEISQKYEVHPNQIVRWKKEFLSGAEEVFKKSRTGKTDTSAKETERLYKKIGQLQVEVDFLKKALE